MARDGNSDDDFYAEPTQYANYGGDNDAQAYSEYPSQPQFAADYGYQTRPPQGEQWYRKPAGLVALGALAVVVAALVIYAIFSLVGRSPSSTPTGTTTAIPPTTTTAPATGGETEIPPPQAPAPPTPPHTETVTVSPTEATTTAPPTTTAETTTTAAPTTSEAPAVSTVTETVTQTRTRPPWPTLFPRPTIDEGGQ